MKKKWESFAEVAFHAMKGALPLWTNASPDTRRAMTRILYDLVFSTGDPNKTGYMSSNAMEAKTKRLKKFLGFSNPFPQEPKKMKNDLRLSGISSDPIFEDPKE